MLSSDAGMVLNAEKRRQLAEVALQRKATPGPSDVDAFTPTASGPGPSVLAFVDQRQNGVAEATASEDEDTCSGFFFKRKRKVNVAVPANSASDAPSFREHAPSVSSPRDLVVQEGGGRVPLGAIMARLLLTCPPSSNEPFCPSKIRKGWRAWMKTPYKSTQPSASGTLSLHLVLP